MLQLPGVQAFGDTGEPFRLELGADTRRIGGVETRRRDFAEYKRSFLIRRNGSALVWNGWLFWRCRGDQTGRPGRVTLTYQRNRANQQGVWLHFILELLARRDNSRRMIRIPFPDGTMFPAPAGRSALSTALLTAVLCVAFGAAPVGASAADAARGGVVSAEAADKLRQHYGPLGKTDGRRIALVLFGLLGAVLIGGGIILLIAYNWSELTRPVRAAISFAPLVLAQVLGCPS